MKVLGNIYELMYKSMVATMVFSGLAQVPGCHFSPVWQFSGFLLLGKFNFHIQRGGTDVIYEFIGSMVTKVNCQ